LAENASLEAEHKRKCRRCTQVKDKTEFRENRRVCKDCNREADIDYRRSDRNEEMAVKFKAEQTGDIEPVKQFYKERNVDLPEEIKVEEIRKLPEINKKNKNVFRAPSIKSTRRIMTEQERKLIKACRLRLKRFFKTKFYKSLTCIGCDSELLKKWLEFNLPEGVTLSDHGKVWHIDHVIPISRFDLSIDRELTICFHWSNLAPLHRIQNMSKGNRIHKDQIRNHLDALKRFIQKENITLDSKYFDVFAKHLDAGTPLEL
jgi:hypothetical protein